MGGGGGRVLFVDPLSCTCYVSMFGSGVRVTLVGSE